MDVRGYREHYGAHAFRTTRLSSVNFSQRITDLDSATAGKRGRDGQWSQVRGSPLTSFTF